MERFHLFYTLQGGYNEGFSPVLHTREATQREDIPLYTTLVYPRWYLPPLYMPPYTLFVGTPLPPGYT